MSTSTATQTFDITIDGKYTVMEVPPRCRNARPVEYETSTVVNVPVVTDTDAPVAFEIREIGERVRQVRTWDGNLYAPYRPFSGQTETSIAGDEHFPAERSADWYVSRDASSAGHFADLLAERYADFLIVDVDDRDEVWVPCSEPRYVVQTFGVGSNHGGTALMVTGGDNSNVKATAYFRADDFESARAYGLQIAARRSDTESVARIEAQEPEIAVLVPDAVRLVVPAQESSQTAQARADLAARTSAYFKVMDRGWEHSAAVEKATWNAMVKARKALLALTDDPTGINAERRPYEDR